MNPTGLRPGPGDDPRAWTRAVFAAADYAGVAMHGDPSTWQFQAARALLLGDTASLRALADCREPEARLHLAAARWIHGDEARARRELAQIDLEHARRLLALLDQPRIRVLAQLPWVDGAMTDLGGGLRHDPRFELRTLGHRTGDVRNPPYADVRTALADGFTPDFYLAAMVEWQHLPPNLQLLRCPLFGNLADHDLHIQTIRPWLDLFDELCVTDRTEWLDVQGLGRGTTTSFPKVFGLPANLAPIPSGPRHLDFFVSGTMLDPYHPDKARVLHELLGMPAIDLRVVRGFTGQMAFHALLAASKASFTFVRRPGAMPTRGLESVALGCAVAVQAESSLRLWLGHEHGVVPYGGERGELAAAVRTILDHHDHFGPAARRGAERVRTEFAMPVVASQYFRFLAFRATAPRAARTPVDTSTWTQKRLCVSRTWLPDDPTVRRRTMQANFRRLSERFRLRPDARTLVDMARELLCEYVHYERKKAVEANERALLADAIGLLEKCVQKWPDHLAARFLLVRTRWHHGDARQRLQALQLAFDTVDAEP
ncbi:MAG: glycosyltransferase, partial [Planctomycetes bacterium]|nr:glycosyltransferase [Planctomycetota bacterium]